MTTSDAHFKPPTQPRRRWHQFSLRTLLVGMAVVGFGTAWLSVQVKQALDQRRVVAALAAVADLEFAKPRSWVQRNAWLRAWLGDEAIQDVRAVYFRLWESEELESTLAHLRGLTQLEVMDLNPKPVTDAGLARLEGLTQLEYLYLNNTQASDAGLAHLRGLTQLQGLDLSELQVSDAGMVHLNRLKQLRWLRLSQTQVSDAGLAHLSGLTQLEVLHLDHTQVSDAGLAHLSGLTQLKVLYLDHTQVSDAGIAQLRESLPKLFVFR